MFCPAADVNLDISKPLKVNFSFVKLDQVKQFMEKIKSKSDYETQEKSASVADSLPKKGDTSTSQCYKGKISDLEDHGDRVQKSSPQENLWRDISCCQKISVHTTQMVVSMEPHPNPSKPCLLASLSNLSGHLNVKANSKSKGKAFFYFCGIKMRKIRYHELQ